MLDPSLPQGYLPLAHLPLIDLMVEPEKMQKTMDDQPVNLLLHGVVPPHGLAFRGVNGNGNISQVSFLCGRFSFRKGKDIGGMGSQEKPAIQRFDFPVVAEQDAT